LAGIQVVRGSALMGKHLFSEFDQLCLRVAQEGIEKWSDIEGPFLHVVEKFDADFALGRLSAGSYKAKARYFNELVIALLQNWSGQTVVGPVHRDSQLFHEIDIDICYPAEGVPKAAAEVKAIGTPGHTGNNFKPRPGRSDVHKRVREVAFTSTDLKAAYAKPTPIKTFTDWVQRTDPAYFSFWAVRVADQADYETVRSVLVGLRNYCNGVGAIIYSHPEPTKPAYVAKKVPELNMDKALRAMAQSMVNA
jgi:hypothetical protein